MLQSVLSWCVLYMVTFRPYLALIVKTPEEIVFRAIVQLLTQLPVRPPGNVRADPAVDPPSCDGCVMGKLPFETAM
jgi:hypothetical protein